MPRTLHAATVLAAAPLARSEELLVCGSFSNSVLTYDGSSGSFTGAIDRSVGPDGRLYVCHDSPPSAVRFDLEAGGPPETFVAPESGGLVDPIGFDWGTDGHLYVASRETDAVDRHDGRAGAFLDVFVEPGAGDGAGTVNLPVTIPPTLAGRTAFFQSLAPDCCRVSDVVRFAFP